MRRVSLAALLLAAGPLLAADKPPDKPVPAASAAKAMTLPEGFQATLFAGEPDVVQPIAFTFDDRGRMWVVECLSYPQWSAERKGKDRVLILEDTDGDGTFDKKTVFLDNGQNLTGIEVGFGGVWLCSTPYLLFVPDKDGDDKPDGPAVDLLDGWDLKAKHNAFNGLTWGPDGWLWGCNGIIPKSKVGKPGAADKDRVAVDCGVWRYHPTKHTFETVAHGTTNPWGLDFDDYGQAFITNCVIAHAWHAVPGGHYERMYGQDVTPNTYALMPTIADHLHWAGGHWTEARGGEKHSDAGGGHAHSGGMVYLGDNLPDKYRNGLFTCNIHGSRVNHDRLERSGSSYVARHEKDFLFANDPWFRGVAIKYGPDGGVYVSDWTDTGECHNYVEVDRSNGRIYRVTFGSPKHTPIDLAKLSDAELVKLQLHKNDWHVRHARRLLQERAEAGKLEKGTHDALRTILKDNADVTRKLRALWALWATGGLDDAALIGLTQHDSEYVRAWAVRLAVEDRKPSGAVVERLRVLGNTDTSLFVRLAVASAAQRVPVEQRADVLIGLVVPKSHAEDPYLPYMAWYAAEPLVAANLDQARRVLFHSNVPLVTRNLTRRLLAMPDPTGRVWGMLAAELTQSDGKANILQGIQDAYAGQRSAPAPKDWSELAEKLMAGESAEVRERTNALSVIFGDAKALTRLRDAVRDAKKPAAERLAALQTLLTAQKPEELPLLQDLLGDKDLRGAAVRGLAAFADDKTPGLVLKAYPGLTDAEKADAVATLASRPKWALELIDAADKGVVARKDVTAFTLRQLAGSKDKAVAERVAFVFGSVKPASKDKAELLAKWKKDLSPDVLAKADKARGRALFAKNCAACHRLFDDGGNVGPELTGSQRANLDYVLENVLDPSAVVPREYQVTVLELNTGRVINGIVKEEGDKAVVVQTQNERVTIPKGEIETRNLSPVSMMPEGVLVTLTKEEVRDLVAYLASPSQVPLPKGG